jgi:hypothetical protein
MNDFYRSDLYRSEEEVNVREVLDKKDPIFVMFISNSNSSKKDRFKQYIYGTLENLQKCVIEVKDIFLNFDIEMQTNVIYAEKTAIQTVLSNNSCRKIDIIRAKPFREFYYEQKFYARCYFDCFENRIEAMDAILSLSSSMIVNPAIAKQFAPNVNLRTSTDKYIIGSDERKPGDMIFKIAREYNISLSSWNLITDYKIVKEINGILCLSCSVHNIYYAPCNPNRYSIKWVADKYAIPE